MIIDTTYIGRITAQAIYWIALCANVYLYLGVVLARFVQEVINGEVINGEYAFGFKLSVIDFIVACAAAALMLWIGHKAAGGTGAQLGSKIGLALGGKAKE